LEAAPCFFGPPLDVYVSHGFLSFLSIELPSENHPAMAKWRVLQKNRSLTRAAL
jgi:hypothetical protein